MEKRKVIKFWLGSAKKDWLMVEACYEKKQYSYALFFGQLVLEKTLKALYITKDGISPPYSHNLVYLAGRCGLDMDKRMVEDLREISGFNIDARYDDYKLSFYLKATKKFTEEYLLKIKEIREWLEKQISKK